MNKIKNKQPVVIDVSISDIKVSRYSFYTPAFVVEDDNLPRSVEVFGVKDLLSLGVDKEHPAYIYCSLAFAQKPRVESVYIVSKRNGETYLQALLKSPLSMFYYISIESQDENDIVEISDYFIKHSIHKLLFITKYEDITSFVKGRKNIVWWWSTNFWFWDSSAIVGWDSGLDAELQIRQYPEAVWISRCANAFPSKMQWLMKELIGVSPHEPFNPYDPSTTYGWEVENQLDVLWDSTNPMSVQYPQEYDTQDHINPDNLTLSNLYDTIMDSPVTWGSGATCDGEWIDHRVFEDWMMWAIQRNIWKLLKTSPKINATRYGLDQIELKIKEVLDFGVQQDGILSYKITRRFLDRVSRTCAFDFTYERGHAIIGVVQINGTVYS